MILSVSRRTDIPNYYSDWFFNRIRAGFLYVRNPLNPRQVSRIPLSPELVDCIVFWTKNPEPMLSRLDELAAWHYYFQFTLTGYGRDIEPGVPHKKTAMIPIFQELSRRIGRKRVVWRYDPILFTRKYTPEYHLRAFEQIAGELQGCTSRCVISFVDIYTKNSKNMRALQAFSLTGNDLAAFAGELAALAHRYHLQITACAEAADLSPYGIGRSSCIDRGLIEELTGYKIKANQDKNQRNECGCIESIETGTYNTCKNGCLYCYANHSRESVIHNCRRYDADSPLLCGVITEHDKITERKIKSLRDKQEEQENPQNRLDICIKRPILGYSNTDSSIAQW